MDRLAAADPVTERPAVESPERLRHLIEDGTQPMNAGAGRDGRARVGKRVVVGALLAIGASAAGVLLVSGSSGPGVNVAAAAYAATSPQSGVIEAVFIVRILRGSQAGGTLHQREWNDAKAGLRRELDSTTGPYGDTGETHVLESVTAPGRSESWSGGSEANVVQRKRTPRGTKVGLAFGGIALYGVEGIEFYRQLYRLGGMRLAGHERHDGRLLWKLESHPAGPGRDVHTRLIVLVDPKTFLPVSERQLDIALPGRPTIVESNLLSYRHLTRSESEGKLFDLAAQHPGARVVTSSMDPRFRPLHRRKAAGKRR